MLVEARTHYTKDEVSALTGAYIDVFMPDEKSTGGTDHERAVKAVRERLRRIEETAKKTEPSPPIATGSAENATPAATL